jgi:bacteriocin biosynthesis cyclodehydratase domain-containing protein
VSNAEHRAVGQPDSDDSLHPEGGLTSIGEGGGGPQEATPPLRTSIRPRMKRSVTVFVASDETIYFIRPSEGDLMVKAPPRGLAAFLRRLDGELTAAALAAVVDGGDGLDVDAIVTQLWALGLLEDAAGDGTFGVRASDVARYDRQLGYFAELAPPGLHREELQARLAEAQVTILGLGGLGCWVASALACTGIGRLVVVDGDVVELSNLNRQILYTPDDIGKSKALTGARALQAFNPSIEVIPIPRRLEDEEAVVAAARGSAMIAELADWPVGKITRWAAGASHRLGIPHIQASQDPPAVRFGPTFIPGETGCGQCQARRFQRQHELYDEMLEFSATRVQEIATFGPACAMIGGVLANEIVNVLLGMAPPATLGRAAMIDLRTLEWSWGDRVPADPQCPVCSNSRAAAQLRDGRGRDGIASAAA